MNRADSVEEYILKSPEWQEELIFLRKLILSTELEEGVKWGGPIYMLKGKNVLGMASFKSWVTLWFHQGMFLNDFSNVLINAQEGKTVAMRQWRFEKGAEFNPVLIKQYVEEAIKNQKQGKEYKVVRQKTLDIPVELQEAFAQDAALKSAFKSLSLGKRREFADYIAFAKQEKTRYSRLEKCKPLLLNGIGLNDKYK